jgi:uncharacterized protein (UPF0335 family)
MARSQWLCLHSSMIAKQLELVLEKIRRLPEERQAAAVEALEVIAAQDDAPLTGAQIQGVKLAQQAVRAGEHASEAAVGAFFARFRA